MDMNQDISQGNGASSQTPEEIYPDFHFDWSDIDKELLEAEVNEFHSQNLTKEKMLKILRKK